MSLINIPPTMLNSQSRQSWRLDRAKLGVRNAHAPARCVAGHDPGHGLVSTRTSARPGTRHAAPGENEQTRCLQRCDSHVRKPPRWRRRSRTKKPRLGSRGKETGTPWAPSERGAPAVDAAGGARPVVVDPQVPRAIAPLGGEVERDRLDDVVGGAAGAVVDDATFRSLFRHAEQ